MYNMYVYMKYISNQSISEDLKGPLYLPNIIN